MKPFVKLVSELGAIVMTGDGNQSIGWFELCAAARQSDAELARIYTGLLEQAEAMALDRSPIIVSYGRDSSNVWFTAWPHCAWGGVGLPRTLHGMTIVAADEGGTLPQGHLAEAEAKAIAERISRIWPSRQVRIQEGH